MTSTHKCFMRPVVESVFKTILLAPQSKSCFGLDGSQSKDGGFGKALGCRLKRERGCQDAGSSDAPRGRPLFSVPPGPDTDTVSRLVHGSSRAGTPSTACLPGQDPLPGTGIHTASTAAVHCGSTGHVRPLTLKQIKNKRDFKRSVLSHTDHTLVHRRHTWSVALSM